MIKWLAMKINARWHSHKQQSVIAIFHDDGLHRAYYLNGSKIKESY